MSQLFILSTDSNPRLSPARSHSLASSSSSSILTRRSRTRTRSRQREKTTKGSLVDQNTIIAHSEDGTVLAPAGSTELNGQEGSFLNGEDILIIGHSESPEEEVAQIEPAETELQTATKRSSSPRRPNKPPLSDSTKNVRDSMVTNTSSSVYPLSTSNSTISGPDTPPSPRSVANFNGDNFVTSVDPEGDQNTAGFDADDVSYRLRLLVKNNYFLPPAHSKPSPSDFLVTSAPPPKKPQPTAFLDLFRGKSRPKTPDTTARTMDVVKPVLRTTSDSTTASGYVLRTHARSIPQSPLASPQDRMGRVVVVREKMDDLMGAAKRAEQDMKSRQDSGSQRAQPDDGLDVIDPTDAVDLPPPPPGYPFAVQASAVHALRAQDSVGAAALAEYLPPHGPGMVSSVDFEDNAWRKALLHELVGHSLNNSPAVSTFASSPPTSPKPRSPMPTSPLLPFAPRAKPVLDQRILPVSEQHKESLKVEPVLPPLRRSIERVRPRGLSIPDIDRRHPAARTSYLPTRAETPANPHMPLTPPPRRLTGKGSDARGRRPSTSPGPSNHSKMVRKAKSSPRLHEFYGPDTRDAMTLTPPPMPVLHLSPPPSRNMNRQSALSGTGFSSFSDTDALAETEDPPRPSMTLSLPTDGRPSLSLYSQPSPTASAFQDTWSDGDNSNMPRVSFDRPPSRASSMSPPVPRYSAMSPPPRVSSSLACIALSPPPRPTGLRHNPAPKPSSSYSPSPSHTASSNSRNSPMGNSVSATFGPATPPQPSSEREKRSNPPLSLSIPLAPIPVTVHSAPPPASPTSFFDKIQSAPNAMDDLDSSSDESDFEGNDPPEDTITPPVFVDPQTHAISNRPSISSSRPSLMRLGNHSTPYITRSVETLPPSPSLYDTSDAERKKPISNLPQRPRFFSYKNAVKGELGKKPASTFDFYQYMQRERHSSSDEPGASSPLEPIAGPTRQRPSTAENSYVRSWQKNQSMHGESLKKFDAKLLRHMEAERDIFRKVKEKATTSNGKSRF